MLRERPHPSFWILVSFLVLAFVTGGSSRANVGPLLVLRPISVLFAFYAVVTLPAECRRAGRYPLLIAGAVLGLTLAHLVPLPPAIWHSLPGRGIVEDIQRAASLKDGWRPLSMVPGQTVNALCFLATPLAALLLTLRLSSPDRLRLLIVLLALAGMSAVIGLLQAAGGRISWFHVIDAAEEIEASGLFANQNHQAALLATMLPMLAVAARLYRRQNQRGMPAGILAAGAAMLISILVIVTGSRAGLALGVIALGFTLFYGLVRIDWIDRVSQRKALGFRLAIGAAVVGGAALVALWSARDLAFSRLASVDQNLRPRLWKSIVPMLPDYQPWGSGIGSYVEVYRIAEPDALLRPTYSNHAHNEVLEIALTAGIPGLILLAATIAMLMVALWRSRRGQDADTIFARLGCTIVVILGCASITDYPLRTPLLATVLAIAAAWCIRPPATGGSPSSHPQSGRVRR